MLPATVDKVLGKLSYLCVENSDWPLGHYGICE